MSWKPDWGLCGRMAPTMFLLFVFYIVSAGLLIRCFDGLSIMAGFMGVFFFTQFFSNGKIVLYSMSASIVDEDDGPQARKLHAMVGRLFQQADLPKPKVAIADTHVPNTFATGRSQKNSAICVTTGLMETLDDDELENVIIHELAHVKSRDMVIMVIAPFLFSTVFPIVCWGWFLGSDDNRQNTPVIVAIITSLVVRVTSYLLVRVLSCYREYATDCGIAVITGHPSVLAPTLFKISGRIDNALRRNMHDTSEMSAFFIAPIKFGFIGHLFNTHPLIENRIERLHDMEREMGTVWVPMRLFDLFCAMLGINAESDMTTKADPKDPFGTSTAYLTMKTDL